MGPAPLVNLNQVLLGVRKLGFDTPPFIYLIERHPTYLQVVRDIFARLDAGFLTGYSSVITLIEVLSQPKRTGNIAVERAYSEFLLNSAHLSLLRVDEAIADRAADLRARYNLRTPDAIQLATAIHAGCQAFLTNDLALRRVTDLRVLVLSTLTL